MHAYWQHHPREHVTVNGKDETPYLLNHLRMVYSSVRHSGKLIGAARYAPIRDEPLDAETQSVCVDVQALEEGAAWWHAPWSPRRPKPSSGSRDVAVRIGPGVVAGPRGLLDNHHGVRLQPLEPLPGRDQHALSLIPLLQLLCQRNAAEAGRQVNTRDRGHQDRDLRPR